MTRKLRQLKTTEDKLDAMIDTIISSGKIDFGKLQQLHIRRMWIRNEIEKIK